LVSNSDPSGKKSGVPPTTLDDHALAARLAADAGALLVDLRARAVADAEAAGGPVDGKALGRAGDRQAHDLLMAGLAAARPGDAVLSEEGVADPARLDADRVWIVDPLDGTREYGEVPREDWAVHVALVVSRSRPPAEATLIADALGAEIVALGSAGAKTMAVVLGDADVYPHSGGQYEWDSAAPVAVAAAAGLHVSRLDGSPLRYNQPDPWLPDVLICRPDLADAVIRTCHEVVA
jgi:3'(2'), 5'-bisphosphate nucleotidase